MLEIQRVGDPRAMALSPLRDPTVCARMRRCVCVCVCARARVTSVPQRASPSTAPLKSSRTHASVSPTPHPAPNLLPQAHADLQTCTVTQSLCHMPIPFLSCAHAHSNTHAVGPALYTNMRAHLPPPSLSHTHTHTNTHTHSLSLSLSPPP